MCSGGMRGWVTLLMRSQPTAAAVAAALELLWVLLLLGVGLLIM